MTRFFRRRKLKHTPIASAAVIAACAGLGVAMSAGPAGAASTQASTGAIAAAPAGFWNGTDSSTIAIPGSAPYNTRPSAAGTADISG